MCRWRLPLGTPLGGPAPPPPPTCGRTWTGRSTHRGRRPLHRRGGVHHHRPDLYAPRLLRPGGITLEQLQAITEQYPTPFHLYDEKGIRENARRLYQAFSWNPGYREFFAVKAPQTPRS